MNPDRVRRRQFADWEAVRQLVTQKQESWIEEFKKLQEKFRDRVLIHNFNRGGLRTEAVFPTVCFAVPAGRNLRGKKISLTGLDSVKVKCIVEPNTDDWNQTALLIAAFKREYEDVSFNFLVTSSWFLSYTLELKELPVKGKSPTS